MHASSPRGAGSLRFATRKSLLSLFAKQPDAGAAKPLTASSDAAIAKRLPVRWSIRHAIRPAPLTNRPGS
jgi:hypothetical protein